MKLITLIFGLVFTASFSWSFDFGSYSEITFEGVLQENDGLRIESDLPENSIVTFGVPPKYKFTIRYSGKFDEISEGNAKFLYEWQRLGGGGKDFVGLYTHELVLEHDNREYRVPVQAPVMPYFAQELKKDDLVELYVVYPGWVGLDPVLLVTEFKCPGD